MCYTDGMLLTEKHSCFILLQPVYAGHIKFKVKISTYFQFYVKFYLFPHI